MRESSKDYKWPTACIKSRDAMAKPGILLYSLLRHGYILETIFNNQRKMP